MHDDIASRSDRDENDFWAVRDLLLSTYAITPTGFNLVAEAGDGSFAAYGGLTFDEANRRGIVEPVCTHPAHRRRGLAKALIRERLRRLQHLGVTNVYVDTGDMVPANRLYESVGFTEAYPSYAWRKSW